MEQDPKQVKERVLALYEIIEDANNALKDIRSKCKHENFTEGNYMWAPGHINSGAICDTCGEFLGTVRTQFEWVEEWNRVIVDKGNSLIPPRYFAPQPETKMTFSKFKELALEEQYGVSNGEPLSEIIKIVYL